MRHVLDPLARVPGVRTAALVTPDGVPITVHGEAKKSQGRAPESGETSDPRQEMDALAALATAWIGEIQRSVAPLSWDRPTHLVLRAARGTLVIMEAPGALLLLVLDSGTSADELRLPMEAAVARMQRHLRAIDERRESNIENVEPQGIFPARNTDQAHSHEFAHESMGTRRNANGVPEVSGE